MAEPKKCFVIAPIGEDKSAAREHSDTVLKYIIALPFAREAVPEDLCPIYKLHGSADWSFNPRKRDEDKLKVASVNNLKEGYKPLIAMPGTTKQDLCTGHLEVIWQNAMDEIRLADTIVFLGYRFPPSDSLARTEVLQAIQKNKSPHLRVVTVLGPDVESADSRRLRALLEVVLEVDRYKFREDSDPRDQDPTYSVVPQPLFVEDFLSVLNQRLLRGWG